MKKSSKEIEYILKFLKTIPIFEAIQKASLQKIANQITEKLIRSKEILYLKGERSENIFIIRYGEINIENESGTIFLTAKDLIGENSLISENNHSSSAIAIIDSLVYQIPGKLFLQLASSEKNFSKNIIKLMANRMRFHMEDKSFKKKITKRLFFHIPLEINSEFKKEILEIHKNFESEKEFSILFEAKKFLNLDVYRLSEELTKIRTKYNLVSIYVDNFEEAKSFISLIIQSDFIIFHDPNPETLVQDKNSKVEFFLPRIRNFFGRSIYFTESKKNYEEKMNIKTFKNKDSLARTLISKTRGLSLGGGGARALSHVGLLKVLEKEKIKFDYISGASFGAVIGALYANGLSVAEIEIKVEKFFGGIESAFDPTLPFVSFFKGKNMKQMLKNAFGDKRIEELNIPFVTSAIDLQTGKEHIFDKGPITEALTSAMSLPGAFPPYRLGEKILVDGGIINNVPENLIREKGADIILGVNVSPMYEIVPVKLFDDRANSDKSFFRYLWEQIKYPPILQIMTRTITLEGREITKLKKTEMDLFVHFHMEEFQLFDFRSYKAIIKKGEEEAKKNISEIKKLFFNTMQ